MWNAKNPMDDEPFLDELMETPLARTMYDAYCASVKDGTHPDMDPAEYDRLEDWFSVYAYDVARAMQDSSR